MKGYKLPSTELHLGTARAILHDIVVLTQPLGTGVLDSMYGNLGQTLVAGFESYTIDFSRAGSSVFPVGPVEPSNSRRDGSSCDAKRSPCQAEQ